MKDAVSQVTERFRLENAFHGIKDLVQFYEDFDDLQTITENADNVILCSLKKGMEDTDLKGYLTTLFIGCSVSECDMSLNTCAENQTGQF